MAFRSAPLRQRSGGPPLCAKEKAAQCERLFPDAYGDGRVLSGSRSSCLRASSHDHGLARATYSDRDATTANRPGGYSAGVPENTPACRGRASNHPHRYRQPQLMQPSRSRSTRSLRSEALCSSPSSSTPHLFHLVEKRTRAAMVSCARASVTLVQQHRNSAATTRGKRVLAPSRALGTETAAEKGTSAAGHAREQSAGCGRSSATSWSVELGGRARTVIPARRHVCLARSGSGRAAGGCARASKCS